MARRSEGRSPRHMAMDLLSRREHSRRELVQKLTARGVDGQECEQVVDQLAAEGLQNDARFAESFINSRVDRGSGPVKIRHELDQRGVSSELIDTCLLDLAADWSALARSVRQKRFGSEQPVDYKEKARQARFLQQRGFTAEQAMGAMDKSAD